MFFLPGSLPQQFGMWNPQFHNQGFIPQQQHPQSLPKAWQDLFDPSKDPADTCRNLLDTVQGTAGIPRARQLSKSFVLEVLRRFSGQEDGESRADLLEVISLFQSHKVTRELIWERPPHLRDDVIKKSKDPTSLWREKENLMLRRIRPLLDPEDVVRSRKKGVRPVPLTHRERKWFFCTRPLAPWGSRMRSLRERSRPCSRWFRRFGMMPTCLGT